MKRCRCCTRQRFFLGAFTWFTHFLGVSGKKFDVWAWNMTPIPMGFPTFRQYLEGFIFFIR